MGVTFKLVQAGPALFCRGVLQALSTAWLKPGVEINLSYVSNRLLLLPTLSASPYLAPWLQSDLFVFADRGVRTRGLGDTMCRGSRQGEAVISHAP